MHIVENDPLAAAHTLTYASQSREQHHRASCFHRGFVEWIPQWIAGRNAETMTGYCHGHVSRVRFQGTTPLGEALILAAGVEVQPVTEHHIAVAAGEIKGVIVVLLHSICRHLVRDVEVQHHPSLVLAEAVRHFLLGVVAPGVLKTFFWFSSSAG